MSKQQIFDLFYEKTLVTRSGGGTAKMKMTRRCSTLQEQRSLLLTLTDKDLLAYYDKLLNRDPKIAPPTRPT